MTPAESVVFGWTVLAILLVVLLLAFVRRLPRARGPRGSGGPAEDTEERRGT